MTSSIGSKALFVIIRILYGKMKIEKERAKKIKRLRIDKKVRKV